MTDRLEIEFHALSHAGFNLCHRVINLCCRDFSRTRINDVEKICDTGHRIDASSYADITAQNVWRLQRVGEYPNPSEYYVAVNFSPNSRFLVISGFNGVRLGLSDDLIPTDELYVWDLPESCFMHFGDFSYDAHFVAFDSASKYIIINRIDMKKYGACGCNVLYTIPEGQAIARYGYDQLSRGDPLSIDFSSSGTWKTWSPSPNGRFVTVSDEKRLQFRSSETGTTLSELTFERTIRSVSYSPDGKLIAVGLQELYAGRVEIWGVPTS